jgi:hypothetical protein
MKTDDVPMEWTQIDPSLTVDQDAFRRALVMTWTEPGRAKQLRSILREDDGGRHACMLSVFHQQCKNLQLPPWETPPCYIGTPGVSIDPEILEIGNRLKRCGLSLYEPDPLRALKKAEASK